MYVVFYVDITGVSPSEGSVNGGTMITIYGEYFDPNADSIEVLVGGKLVKLNGIHSYLWIHTTTHNHHVSQ